MSLPIIIIHQGNPFYLSTCIHHAKVYNPNNKIYLLGDESNRHLADEQVSHVLISDYYTQAEAFEPLYRHQTTNPYHYNLFCFQRWFLLKEFMEAMHFEHVFVCESDELLFCDVEKENIIYLNVDFTILNDHLANSILMSYPGIVKFTEFLTSAYSDTELKSTIDKLYQTRFYKGKRVYMGGIDDMTLFSLYIQQHNGQIPDLGSPINGSCWDTGIHHDTGFLMENGIKKITWIDDLPYATYKNGEKVRMLGIHFLGGHKMKEFLFMVDDDKKHIDPKTLRWFMVKQWIIKIFNGFKRFPFFVRRFVQKQSCNFWRKWYKI